VISESSKAWRFTFNCVERVIFEGLPKPRVCIADQGLGLRTAWPLIWPGSHLQFCEWHAAQNIKKRLADKKYLRENREKIMDYVWKYIWSATNEELELNRTELKAQLRPAEVVYLDEHWVPKEPQVIRLYTQHFPNLNCFTTQRDESIHPVVKTLLNPQIRLDQAVLRLFEEMTRFINRIAKAEMEDQIRPRRLLNKSVFFLVRTRLLAGHS